MSSWRQATKAGAAALCLLGLLGLAACANSADIAAGDASNDPATSASSDPTGAPPTDTTATQPAPTDASPTEASPSEVPPSEVPPSVDGERVLPDEAALELGLSEPVEDPYYPETSNPEIDVLHYFLDLDWDGSVLTGEATLTFRPTTDATTTRLGLSSALTVDRVELDGTEIDFSRPTDALEMVTAGVVADTTYTLTIAYAGTPQPTAAPSMRGDMTAGLGWLLDSDGNVSTFQEPYGAFTWYPVNDHPSDEALYDARITTYGTDIAVFNGERVEHAVADGSATSSWHLDEPMASYLATIAIGPYREYVDATPSGFPISYWLLARDRDLLGKLKRDGDAAFPWLVEHAGPYPFSSLGVVVVGGDSGMETQTMVTMSRPAVLRSDAVLLHEFAHMWYGNSVSPTDWRGLWLNEGWAMYLQQWFESDTGIPVYGGGIKAWRLYDNQSRLLAGPPGDWDPAWFGDTNVYLGPAIMLDRIRQRVGDAAFEEIVKAWPAEHENQNVDRAEFTEWVNSESGQDLTSLIDRWLDSPTTPR